MIDVMGAAHCNTNTDSSQIIASWKIIWDILLFSSQMETTAYTLHMHSNNTILIHKPLFNVSLTKRFRSDSKHSPGSVQGKTYSFEESQSISPLYCTAMNRATYSNGSTEIRLISKKEIIWNKKAFQVHTSRSLVWICIPTRNADIEIVLYNFLSFSFPLFLLLVQWCYVVIYCIDLKKIGDAHVFEKMSILRHLKVP